MTKDEYKKKYDDFMRNKEKYLADLGKLVGIDQFTFVKEEIEKVDDFFRLHKEKFANKEPEYHEFERYFYAYFGIAYITKYGGTLEFNDEKRDDAFGTPVIIHPLRNYRLAPSDWKSIVRDDLQDRLSFFYRLDKMISFLDDDDDE